jgi:hypothetical protein
VCLTHQSSGSGTTGLSDAAVAKDWNGKCEGRRPPGGFRHKCQAYTEVGLKKKGMLEGCELHAWFQIGTNAGWCESSMSINNLLGSINCGQFLGYLRNWKLLKKEILGGFMCLIRKDLVCLYCNHCYIKFLEQPKEGICHFRLKSTRQNYRKW